MNNTDYGRPDMQLAREKGLGVLADNIKNQRLDREIFRDKIINKWGSSDDGTPLSAIVRSLCRKGGGICYIAKSEVFKDVEIDEIIDNIAISADIIPEGWDEPITSQEQIQADIEENGGEVEIVVKLIKNEMD
jgi:hypothetical protein